MNYGIILFWHMYNNSNESLRWCEGGWTGLDPHDLEARMVTKIQVVCLHAGLLMMQQEVQKNTQGQGCEWWMKSSTWSSKMWVWNLGVSAALAG